MPKTPSILVERARTHNLKGVSCRIPHRAVTVVTGPSGAGKSSLAFDTVFAEGQRRFVESMSTYARQFLDQMERPPVDDIQNILPAVALEAKNAVRNARSTVGTITEAMDVLRLLYTHLGEVVCPRGHGLVRTFTPDEAAEELVSGIAGGPFLLVVRVPRPRKSAEDALGELIRQGFQRRLDGEEVVRMEPGEKWPAARDPLPLVLGRFPARADAKARILDTLEQAWRMSHGEGGRVEARGPEGVRFYGRELSCPVCGETARRPTPALFSFNSPLGACPRCQGFGRIIGIDRERVIPDPRRSLSERPIAPWNTPAYEELYDELLKDAKKRGISLSTPWAELKPEDREWVWSGKGRFTNLEEFFHWLEGRTYKVHVRVLLARYRAYNPCLDCGGTRLQPEALNVRLQGKLLPDLTGMSIETLRSWLAAQRWTDRQRQMAGHLLDELKERIEVLHRVGLDY
ncbi:MAG TPA: excinuclease ABC subunit A, partial [Thermoanaerobaculia bacterium]|nr:excinuclease ABC subunit A [Thermoanaerobaculia bacterium]